MGKYNFITTESVVSVHKLLILEYEQGYGGDKKELQIKVYPYTVEEKLELKNLNQRKDDLIKEKKIKESEVISEELTLKSVKYILMKDDKEITDEIINKMPKEWFPKILYKALEFEGFEESELKNLAKKEIDKLQA